MQGMAVDTTPIPPRLLTRGFRGYSPVLIGTQNTVIPTVPARAVQVQRAKAAPKPGFIQGRGTREINACSIEVQQADRARGQ